MHLKTISNCNPRTVARTRRKLRRAGIPKRAAMLILAASIAGCASYAERPEITPDLYSPAAADQQWSPAAHEQPQYHVAAVTQEIGQAASEDHSATVGSRYDLPRLIDLALRLNPSTRQSWQAARSAAAS
jgi:hypothetical protein